MAFADNNGVKIYYRVEGNGPPLLLHHWSFATLEDWYEPGYVSLLKKKFTLILMDARGNGRSQKGYQPEDFGLKNRVRDILAVLNDLCLTQASFFGYSLGAWIGFSIAAFAPERFDALILGGAHPYPQNLDHLRRAAQTGIDSGADAFITTWETNFRPLSITQKQRIQTYDFKSILAGAADREDISEILPGFNIPTLLFSGDKDPVYSLMKKCGELMPSSVFLSIPNQDHGSTLTQTGLIVPHIIQFLKNHNIKAFPG